MSEELKPCICGSCISQDACVSAKLNNVSSCVSFDPIIEPCNYCKGTDVRYTYPNYHPDGQMVQVQCDDCKATGPHAKTREQACVAWNTRPAVEREVVKKIIDGIWRDIDGRRGFHLHNLDGEIKRDIKRSWRKIIKAHLTAANKIKEQDG